MLFYNNLHTRLSYCVGKPFLVLKFNFIRGFYHVTTSYNFVFSSTTSKTKDVYSVVDKAIEVVQQSGVRYEVGAMETTLEGELDVLLDVIKRAQQACVDAGAEEVITSIKIHYRPSTGVTIDEKVWKYRDEYAKPEAI